jgi:Na+-transporting methylmalonyl-CoA/oxaloacetate decarboxylase gamma subunit
MTQQLLVPLVSAFTGITAVFVLFGLLFLASFALNRIFPHTQAEDEAEKEKATSLHVSPQVDEETVAVIQAAIAAHLKRLS